MNSKDTLQAISFTGAVVIICAMLITDGTEAAIAAAAVAGAGLGVYTARVKRDK